MSARGRWLKPGVRQLRARGQWPACALTADPPRALRPPAPAPRDVQNVIGHHFRICGSRCPGNTEECRSRARAVVRDSAGGRSREQEGGL